MENKIEVEWTGSYPNLCSRYWIIKINDKDCCSGSGGGCI